MVYPRDSDSVVLEQVLASLRKQAEIEREKAAARMIAVI
jgi:hypothetical protein